MIVAAPPCAPHRAKRQKFAWARQEQEKQSRSAEEEGGTRRTSLLLPALAPISSMMAQQGWIFETKTPENGLEIFVYKGDMRSAAGTGRPSLKLVLNSQNATITIYEATTWKGASDPKGVAIAEVTPDFLQERVARFIEALISAK